MKLGFTRGSSGVALRPGALVVAILLLVFSACDRQAATGYDGASIMDERMESLIAEIVRDTRQTRSYTGRETLSPAVIEAMRRVPRDRFVPPDSALYAWENRPLGIGHGQTISQPFIVALMTDLLDVAPGHRVLEIGTGSGYQAAVLSLLVSEVHTIEIVPELAESAANRLRQLGYRNVAVKAGDGRQGWAEFAPFDRIMVTAVGEDVPPKLLEQLAVGGRMVMPIGPQRGGQNLTVIDKSVAEVSLREVLPVQFVPLTGSN